MQLTSVNTLNGINYEDWKESLDLYLAISNLDLALRENEPPALTDESTQAQRSFYEKWEHSNRVCLMVIKHTMEKSIRQSIPESNNARDYLRSVGEKFTTFDKAQKGQYLSLLENTKYDGVSGVREHIMKLINYYNKLKSLKVDLGDSYLVWQVLESLPPQFDVLKTSYNTQNTEWTINEMIAIVSQEEANMKKGKMHTVQVATSHSRQGHKWNKNKSHSRKERKGKTPLQLAPIQTAPPKKTFFKGNCKYCKKFGHKVEDCFFLKKKNERQGMPSILACFESNVVDVPPNSWWFDSGATIHVVNSLQGFTSLRRPNEAESKILMGDGARALVQDIGTVSLPLPSGHVLILNDVAYVPSIRRNLISISVLDKFGYTFVFGNRKLSISFKSSVVG